MNTQITFPEDRAMKALRWINGDTQLCGWEEVKETIEQLGHAFRFRFLEQNPGSTPPRQRPILLCRLPTIDEVMGTIPDFSEPQRPKKEKETKETEVKEKPVQMKKDSVMLLNAIGHVAKREGEQLSSSKAQLILYCIYGSHLAHTGERLDIEHPQAWKYGPVFPIAYRKANLQDDALCDESYEFLSEQDPQLASLVYNKTSAMLRTPMTDLNICHKGKKSPYARTVGANPDKWGIPIDDELIKSYFTSTNNQIKQ